MSIQVLKGNGEKQAFDHSKLQKRIEHFMYGLDARFVDVLALADTVAKGSEAVMPSDKIDELLSQSAAYLTSRHPDYSLLAGRIAVSALHKGTKFSFIETFKDLYGFVNPKNGEKAALISQEAYDVAMKHADTIEAAMNYKNDFNYEYFGFKTLERSYLLRLEKNGKRFIAERPQHMLMRVAIGIHFDNIERVLETYKHLSEGMFTHATPTLFNAGTPNPQMSSCFLVAMKDDSIEGIYDTLKTCALISKTAGGIGVHVHNIRSNGSYIRGTNGESNGLVPMLRVFNDTARYVDQGGGKRKGSFAVYLEPWHADVFDFIQMKKNTGKEENRARDLFYALWIPDLFMKRVHENGTWSLFDPNSAKGLHEVWGQAFEDLYTKYEREGLALKTVPAHTLWFAILQSQIETGTPYLLYKDAANSKSNQQHLGTIKCSNLCTEIIEYTAADEVAVCNLASIALPKYVTKNDGDATYDHEKLHAITKTVTYNLNKVIDRNYYPVIEAENSNMRHRPIGIGVQGLADAFIMMGLPFSSPKAQRLQEDIFETIYHAACEASMEMAKEEGPFQTWKGCPMSEGKFQFDLWKESPKSGRYQWDALRKEVMQFGMRNSLLVAPMPTASTSQILGNNECFEPFTSNIYLRRVLSGEFPVVNKYLVRDLIDAKLWNEDIRNQIIAYSGSVQKISVIPQHIRELYKTVWEIKQKDLIDMAVQRSKYIDQSQSLNLFLESPTKGQLTSMHFYAWSKGLKTGQYYLRTRPAVDAIKMTVDTKQLSATEKSQGQEGSKNNEPEECLNCGS
eukprot:TRINITY_DN2313_c3_g1_i1.p1 TRINITY_DN2313_c3_g1~~TRINITY_DN2313_c3_g1_i1.p1  ORF type:complete len:793 (+),score=241.51 TRINITY_DN2313_c3_g1_i1:76-2454(+)